MIRVRFVWLVLLLLAEAPQANFSPPRVTTDGMILQRDKPECIWGKRKEGAEVKAWIAGGQSNIQWSLSGSIHQRDALDIRQPQALERRGLLVSPTFPLKANS